MNTIYIIQAASGDYSDYNEKPMCAVACEERAKVLVNKCQKFALIKNAIDTRIDNEVRCPFYANTNNRKNYPPSGRPVKSLEFKQAQNRCANGKGSDEDKKAYQKQQQKHMQAVVSWEKELDAIDKFNTTMYENLAELEKKFREENFIISPELQEVAKYFVDNNIASDATFNYYSIEVV